MPECARSVLMDYSSRRWNFTVDDKNFPSIKDTQWQSLIFSKCYILTKVLPFNIERSSSYQRNLSLVILTVAVSLHWRIQDLLNRGEEGEIAGICIKVWPPCRTKALNHTLNHSWICFWKLSWHRFVKLCIQILLAIPCLEGALSLLDPSLILHTWKVKIERDTYSLCPYAWPSFAFYHWFSLYMLPLVPKQHV